MRLVTSVKYLVGFATASSLAILLSGSAMAAESSSNQVEPGSLVSVETQGNVVVSQHISQISVSSTSGNGEAADSALGSVSSEPSLSSLASDSKASQQDVAKTEGGLGSSATGAVQRVQTESNPAVQSSSVSNPLESAASTPVMQADATGRTVVYNSQSLPVQPVIMSQTTAVADLATNIPSAPATTHTPLPVKSTGVLFALTDHLANTIVPGLASLIDLKAMDARLSLLMIIVVTLIVVIGGFAARLKQSGFATAARSDVAMSHLNFATPSGMGYVSLLLQAHGPFFMVSDTKSLEGNRS